MSSQKKQSVSVAASPFNTIKVRLALILVLIPTIWNLANYMTEKPAGQMFILACYAGGAAAWLLMLIRRTSVENEIDEKTEQK